MYFSRTSRSNSETRDLKREQAITIRGETRGKEIEREREKRIFPKRLRIISRWEKVEGERERDRERERELRHVPTRVTFRPSYTSSFPMYRPASRPPRAPSGMGGGGGVMRDSIADYHECHARAARGFCRYDDERQAIFPAYIRRRELESS